MKQIKRKFLLPVGFLVGVAASLGFNHFTKEEEVKSPLVYESFKVQENDNGLYVAKNITKGTDKDFLAFEASDVLNEEDIHIGDTVKAEYRALKGEDIFIGVTEVKAGKQPKTANTSDVPYNDEYTFSSFKITEVKKDGYFAECYNNCVNDQVLFFNKDFVMYDDKLKVNDYVNAVYDAAENNLLKVEKLVENGKGSYVMASALKGGQ
ncbi:hypothetical protein CPT_Stills104 [Bacillus phage Stills]|uniref:Uncharacterized protein n=1 Tax=Bacillus phage Stills TaxID=1610833 RepID=A0A0E3XAQ1_9CAUD|nr:hypothetical protein CPT_Stills104 [Bacillus phage Stills]AKC02732.1 hypothetical protein CPT_Stills104 [Bacillus phage Stills]